jgi:protein SCO1/2
MRSRIYLLVGLALGLFLVLGIRLFQAFLPYTYQGSVIEPANAAYPFELIDENGDTFRLEDENGKVSLLFFGYTHCPDVCPVTLAEMRKVSQALRTKAEDLRFIFVTVDPDRDTPELLKEYLGYFDPNFIGLTGSKEALEQVWKAYGVYRSVIETDSQEAYLVEHTARVYVINREGNLMMTYPFGSKAENIVEDLRHLLK